MSLQVATAQASVIRDAHFETLSGVDTRTLLLEGASTNLCAHSQFDSGWSGSSATVTPNAGVAPDGTTTMASLVEDSTASTTHFAIFSGAATIVNATVYTVSFFAKAKGRTWISCQGDGGGSHLGGSQGFDIGNGVVGALGSGIIRRSITPYANGVYRCSLTATSTGTFAQPAFFLATGDNANVYSGDGVSGVYVWGVQVEAQAAPTSYIATTTTSVTRSADSLYFPFPYTPQAMTVYVKFVERGSSLLGGGVRVIEIAAGGGVPQFVLYFTAGAYTAYHNNGSSAMTAAAPVSPNVGDTVELRGMLTATGAVQIGIAINGAAESVSSLSGALAIAPAWSGQRIYLNSDSNTTTATGLNAFLAVKVVRGVQTLAQMRAA